MTLIWQLMQRDWREGYYAFHKDRAGPGRPFNDSTRAQHLSFDFDLVQIFGLRLDKPRPTCDRGFHFLAK